MLAHDQAARSRQARRSALRRGTQPRHGPVARDDSTTPRCAGRHPLVLVDDELTTGKTAVNAIRALHARWPRSLYVLASLVDCRSDEVRAGVAAAIRELGAQVLSVALLDGHVSLPADVLSQAHGFIAPCQNRLPFLTGLARPCRSSTCGCPDGLPVLALAGWSPAQERTARTAMCRAAAALPVGRDGRHARAGRRGAHVPAAAARDRARR